MRTNKVQVQVDFFCDWQIVLANITMRNIRRLFNWFGAVCWMNWFLNLYTFTKWHFWPNVIVMSDGISWQMKYAKSFVFSRFFFCKSIGRKINSKRPINCYDVVRITMYVAQFSLSLTTCNYSRLPIPKQYTDDLCVKVYRSIPTEEMDGFQSCVDLHIFRFLQLKNNSWICIETFECDKWFSDFAFDHFFNEKVELRCGC